jgi:hypothetical protein
MREARNPASCMRLRIRFVLRGPKLLLGRSEWWWRGLWLRFSLEVPFENQSEDYKHYRKANRIANYYSNCAEPVRTVDIQLCLNTVLNLQDCEGE